MTQPHIVPTTEISRREALLRLAALLGGSISAPAAAGILAGCRGPADADSWTPAVLTPEQDELVLAIAEHIIPETDTPGARAVRVDRFIDVMLDSHYLPEEREHFLAGLAEMDGRAEREYGAAFLQCTPEQQRTLIAALDRETFGGGTGTAVAADSDDSMSTPATALPAGTADVRWLTVAPAEPPPRTDVPFFRTMKELVVIGYYTSEPGATIELRYEAVPGRYDGCVPFSEIGRSWST